MWEVHCSSERWRQRQGGVCFPECVGETWVLILRTAVVLLLVCGVAWADYHGTDVQHADAGPGVLGADPDTVNAPAAPEVHTEDVDERSEFGPIGRGVDVAPDSIGLIRPLLRDDVIREHVLRSGLTSLSLFGSMIGDGGMKHLAGLTRLRRLDLTGVLITDGGLRQLKALTDLRELYLGSTRVTGVGLAHLQASKLEALDLWATRLDDADLGAVGRFSELTYLVLSRTRVSDGGLDNLAALTRLEVLDLSETDVSGPGLTHLRGLTALRRLQLTDTLVDNIGLAHLPPLPRLAALYLNRTQLSDVGLVHLVYLRLKMILG